MKIIIVEQPFESDHYVRDSTTFFKIVFVADNTVKVDYWVGRKDCNSNNGLPVRTFISHDAMDGITLLAKEFNLNEREAVALMGNKF